MTPLSKTFLAFMAIAVLLAGTLALRSSPVPASAPARLTPAQVAEIQPQQKPEPPRPSVSAPAQDDLPPPPSGDADFEDGNGS